MMTLASLMQAGKIILIISLFFVWVVRYENIKLEFKKYNLPDWLRDLVGILKLSFVTMVINEDNNIVLIGSGGLVLLLLAALITHLRVHNPLQKMLPAIGLFTISLIIFLKAL